MNRYRIAPAARSDLREIVAYWSLRASVETADKLLERIGSRFRLLARSPQTGRLCVRIAPGVRRFPAGKYLIYYRHTAELIEIVRVIHGARSQRRAFLQMPDIDNG